MMPATTREVRPTPFQRATHNDLSSCYRILLGREPDDDGWAHWAGKIERGEVDLDGLTRGFLQCEEFQSKHAAVLGLAPTAVLASGPRASTVWKLMRRLISSSRDHAFLDRAWIPGLLRITPRSLRSPLALRLLSLSPHYLVYQWTDRYPASCPRSEVLAREFERNAASRREICAKLLSRFLRPEMTVIDFGCGPGFLAREASAHVAKVIGVDVSRGVVACARHLNPAPNLTYLANRHSDLSMIADASADLIYSFAVFQHLKREQTRSFLREFARILKPGATGVFHTILKDEAGTYEPPTHGWIEQDVELRMVFLTDPELRRILHESGFRDVQIAPVSAITDINDDIGNEHLVTFRC